MVQGQAARTLPAAPAKRQPQTPGEKAAAKRLGLTLMLTGSALVTSAGIVSTALELDWLPVALRLTGIAAFGGALLMFYLHDRWAALKQTIAAGLEIEIRVLRRATARERVYSHEFARRERRR